MIHLEELYDEKDLTINWNFFDSGLLCRVIISAKESINGKLMLQIRETSGERISFFMQPNNLPEDHEPRGFQENGKVSIGVKRGVTEFVPSDWSFYLIYNYNLITRHWPVYGKLSIKAWVEPWTEDDKDALNEFNPTTNYFVA